MQNTQERQAYTAGLAAVLLWSTVATGFKLGLEQLAVDQLLLLGTATSWLVFAGFAAFTRSWRIQRRDWALVVLLGTINPWIYYLVLFGAYDRLPAHIAQPLNYTWAVTLALLAVPILKQALSKRMLAGIAISYAGVVVLLVGASPAENGGWNWAGVGMALGSTVLWACYWLLNTRSTSPPAALMLWSFSGGLPLVALTCILGSGLPPVNLVNLGYGAWVGVIEMGITFLLWQRALRLTAQAARIGQLIFLSPFFSLLMIGLVLGEQITPAAVGGLAIIVAGMVLAQRPT